MKRYAYKALTAARKSVEGEISVNDRDALDSFFVREGLTPVRVEEQGFAGRRRGVPIRRSRMGQERRAPAGEKKDPPPKAEGLSDFLSGLGRPVADTELIAFTRQFAAAYAAGVPVARTLEMLAMQTLNRRFRKVLLEISQNIQAGNGLSQAFSLFPRYFDETYLSMLRSGEVSGNLDKVLDYSAGLLEKKLMHRERIKSTLLYPKIVVGMIGVTFVVILLFVIPQFAKMYEKFGAELPLPTRVMIAISAWGQAYWWLLLLFIPAFLLAKRRLKANGPFMLWFHRQWLKSPIFGPAFLKIELAYFCTTFALLLRSGVKITDATEISIEGMRNSFLKDQLGVIVPVLEAGGSISSALERVPVLPPLVVSMMRVGEESGTLENLLDRVAKMYEDESEIMLKRLPTLIEPVILAGLFVAVLGLALAVYLPMWRMAALLKR